MNDARTDAQADIFNEGDRIVAQRNVEELDAAQHRFSPGLETLRCLAGLPVEMLPGFLNARQTLRVAHVESQRQRPRHRRVHERDDERIHRMVTPIESGLASTTDQVDAAFEARGPTSLGGQLSSVDAHRGNRLLVSRAVEPLDAGAQLDSHPGDGFHGSTVELLVRLLRLEARTDFALQLLELPGRHAAVALPHIDALERTRQGHSLIRFV